MFVGVTGALLGAPKTSAALTFSLPEAYTAGAAKGVICTGGGAVNECAGDITAGAEPNTSDADAFECVNAGGAANGASGGGALNCGALCAVCAGGGGMCDILVLFPPLPLLPPLLPNKSPPPLLLPPNRSAAALTGTADCRLAD